MVLLGRVALAAAPPEPVEPTVRRASPNAAFIREQEGVLVVTGEEGTGLRTHLVTWEPREAPVGQGEASS